MSHTLSKKDWSALRSASAAEERAMGAVQAELNKLRAEKQKAKKGVSMDPPSTDGRKAAVAVWDGHLKHLADIVRGIVQRDRKLGQRG